MVLPRSYMIGTEHFHGFVQHPEPGWVVLSGPRMLDRQWLERTPRYQILPDAGLSLVHDAWLVQ